MRAHLSKLDGPLRGLAPFWEGTVASTKSDGDPLYSTPPSADEIDERIRIAAGAEGVDHLPFDLISANARTTDGHREGAWAMVVFPDPAGPLTTTTVGLTITPSLLQDEASSIPVDLTVPKRRR